MILRKSLHLTGLHCWVYKRIRLSFSCRKSVLWCGSLWEPWMMLLQPFVAWKGLFSCLMKQPGKNGVWAPEWIHIFQWNLVLVVFQFLLAIWDPHSSFLLVRVNLKKKKESDTAWYGWTWKQCPRTMINKNTSSEKKKSGNGKCVPERVRVSECLYSPSYITVQA